MSKQRLTIEVEFDHVLTSRAESEVKDAIQDLRDVVEYVGGTVLKAILKPGEDHDE